MLIGHPPKLLIARNRHTFTAFRSPAGQRSFHGQDRAINAADVVALLEHLRREVPGRLVLIGDGAPMPRRQVIKASLAQGAARRMPLEPLPAYAPEWHPGDGLWAARE